MFKITTLITAMALFLGGCIDRNGASQSDGGRLTLKTVPSSMTVSTRNGDVAVVADPNLTSVSVVWQAHLHAGEESHAAYRAGLTSLSQDWSREGHVLLQAAFAGTDHPDDGMNLIVHVPDLNGLTIETTHGSVVTHGTQGRLTIHNRQGSIAVTDHKGDARLATSNGSVMVNGQVGELIVQTTNGLVQVKDLVGQPHIKATNASIGLELAPGQHGPIFLETSNAPIEFEIGPQFAGTILAETTNASIKLIDSANAVRRVEDGPSTKRITMDQAGQASHIRTSNADIDCRVADL